MVTAKAPMPPGPQSAPPQHLSLCFCLIAVTFFYLVIGQEFQPLSWMWPLEMLLKSMTKDVTTFKIVHPTSYA
ncbi:hypothetical protein E2562_013618 [Oryza meyeriana var. granulata]|uniref:Uncharacterized protein n=1 Tax=Oryza meyeriana var. granulata TaxID=110450 RepID=A0A6G1C5U1_9ORYZ|nr:hypothetical protein E2562_013618 [Oryza meyeriana var. granulata]